MANKPQVMDSLNFNSVETLPGYESRVAFTVNSSSVFKEDVDIVPTIIDSGLSYIQWGGDNQMPFDIISLAVCSRKGIRHWRSYSPYYSPSKIGRTHRRGDGSGLRCFRPLTGAVSWGKQNDCGINIASCTLRLLTSKHRSR